MMATAVLQLETLACPTCMMKITKALQQVPGVVKTSVQVKFNASRATLDFDPNKTALDQLTAAVTKIGYQVLAAQVKEARGND